MKGFIASWFFPPCTSAEGLVTFKLLKASSYQYDVCSSLSNQWSYKIHSQLLSENINTLPIDTDNLNIWVEKCVETYELKREEYDFLMTRSMPPESHKVGLELKKKYPDIYWIASFADPIAYNPYELQAYVKENLPKKLANIIMNNPKKNIPKTKILPYTGLSILRNMQKLEEEVCELADMFIFPSIQQCRYTLGDKLEKYKNKCLIIPHTYDRSLYNDKNIDKRDKFIFTYIGYADSIRNPNKFIHALKLIKEKYPKEAEKIKIRFIGNIPSNIRDTAYAFFLYENISIEEPVGYLESLEIMKESDCLLHVDGSFDFLEHKSIFFASKLADYMGAKKPILGITTQGSPASCMLKNSGNLFSSSEDIESIATNMLKVLNNELNVDYSYYEKYDVENVYMEFDKAVKEKQGNIIEKI